MASRAVVFLAVLALAAGEAWAQDARSVLQAAAAAMGAADMKSIQYSGAGWQGAVGQNFAPDQDWPRIELASYTRTIDFETQSSKVEMVRRQGSYPARGGGGVPIQGEQRLTQFVSGNYAWDLNPQGMAVPQPAQAELRQLEIWLTPHGFLKGAMAGNATAVRRWEYDQWVTVVSFTALGKYRINGTINAQNLVQRVQTWVPNPVAGDMYYENVYTNYRDVGGVKIPRFHQHQDYDDGFWRNNASGGDHAFGLETISEVKKNIAGAALTVPDAVRQATIPAVRVVSEKLADGVWLIGGGSHNSVLVEFKDSVAVIEAPLNEERSLAVIAEVYRLVPNKPIQYIVNTHHHWDHLGGIRTYRHEGATVVFNERNRGFLEEVLTAGPRQLQPDRYSLSPPEEWAEGYTFELVREKFILGDETRTVELHNVQGLQHAAGMLIAYLPKEKIVVQADLYNAPAPNAPPQAAPNASNQTFYRNIQRLKLDAQTIVGIHGRPGPLSGLQQLVSRAQ